jgi:hypothetical protein
MFSNHLVCCSPVVNCYSIGHHTVAACVHKSDPGSASADCATNFVPFGSAKRSTYMSALHPADGGSIGAAGGTTFVATIAEADLPTYNTAHTATIIAA